MPAGDAQQPYLQSPAGDGRSPNISSIRKQLFDVDRPSPPKDPKLAFQLGVSPQPQNSSGNWRRGYVDLIHTPPQSGGYGNYSPITKSATGRRVRAPRMSLPRDAAGLQSAGPWKGRDVPRKGHGLPPPELNESPFHRGSSSAPHHHHRYTGESPIIAFGQDRAYGDPTAAPHASPARPSTASSCKSNISKQMAAVLHEDASKDGDSESADGCGQPSLLSPHRALGIGSPPPALSVNTKDRVMGTNAGLTEDDINPGLSGSCRTAYGALRRPATASAATRNRSSSADILKWSEPPVKDTSSAPRPRTNTRVVSDRALDTWSTREKKLQEKRLEDAPAVWCAANMDCVSNKSRGVSGSFVFG